MEERQGQHQKRLRPLLRRGGKGPGIIGRRGMVERQRLQVEPQHAGGLFRRRVLVRRYPISEPGHPGCLWYRNGFINFPLCYNARLGARSDAG